MSPFKTQSSTKFVCVIITLTVTEFSTTSKFGYQKAMAEQLCVKARERYRSVTPSLHLELPSFSVRVLHNGICVRNANSTSL